MDSRSPQLRPRTALGGGLSLASYDRQPDTTPYVRIKPLSNFPGDQTFTAGASTLEVNMVPDAAYPFTLLRNLRGFRFVNVSGTCYADINGGGARTIIDKDTFDFVTVFSIRLIIPAGGSVTIQQWAE